MWIVVHWTIAQSGGKTLNGGRWLILVCHEVKMAQHEPQSFEEICISYMIQVHSLIWSSWTDTNSNGLVSLHWQELKIRQRFMYSLRKGHVEERISLRRIMSVTTDDLSYREAEQSIHSLGITRCSRKGFQSDNSYPDGYSVSVCLWIQLFQDPSSIIALSNYSKILLVLFHSWTRHWIALLGSWGVEFLAHWLIHSTCR